MSQPPSDPADAVSVDELDDADFEDIEAPQGAPRAPDAVRPPPTPPPGPAGPEHAALPQSQVSAEDMDFIRRVFAQVKDVDFRTPPPAAAAASSGPERKIAGLRDSVRKLERELARVGAIWTHKDLQIAELDSILAHSAAQRDQALQRCAEVETYAAQQATQCNEEAAALRALVSTLHSKNADLSAGLQQLQHDSQADHTQLQGLLDQSCAREQALQAELRTVTADLQAQLQAVTSDLQAQLQQHQQDAAATQKQLQATLEGVEAQRLNLATSLNDCEAALAQAQGAAITTQADLQWRQDDLSTKLQEQRSETERLQQQLRDADQKIDARDKTLMALADKLTEREATTAQLAEEMSRARSEMEARLADMRLRLEAQAAAAQARPQETVGLQAEEKQVSQADPTAAPGSNSIASEPPGNGPKPGDRPTK